MVTRVVWDAGVTSENVAEKYGITRAQQDELAARSHKRAAAARSSGRFRDEIVPVKTIWKDPKTVRVHVQPHAHTVNHLDLSLACIQLFTSRNRKSFVWASGDNIRLRRCAG